MKKLIPVVLLAFTPSVAFADITAKYTTSASMQVDMPYIVTQRAASSYSLSGSNIDVKVATGSNDSDGNPTYYANRIGGLDYSGISGNDWNGVPSVTASVKEVKVAGSAFSINESLMLGDKDPGNVSVTNGIATLPILSGQTTVGAGGSHAGLTITSLSSGAHTCSGANAQNGSGSSCVIQSAVTITLD
jgi:hypothetical protein